MRRKKKMEKNDFFLGASFEKQNEKNVEILNIVKENVVVLFFQYSDDDARAVRGYCTFQ